MAEPTDALNAQTLDALHRILEEEIRQAKLANDGLLRKKLALVENKPQQLMAIDRELTAISQRSRHLELERQRLMAELDAPRMRLEELLPRMDAQQASRFRQSRNRLLRAARDMERLNRETRDLLNLSLKWIHETVELIAAALTPEAASYSAQGGKAGRRSQGDNGPIQSTVNHSA